jgi:hypothetical protein
VVALFAGAVGAALFAGVTPLSGDAVLAGETLFALLAGAAFFGEIASLDALSLVAFSLDPLS